jgi:hypothetical protein
VSKDAPYQSIKPCEVHVERSTTIKKGKEFFRNSYKKQTHLPAFFQIKRI